MLRLPKPSNSKWNYPSVTPTREKFSAEHLKISSRGWKIQFQHRLLPPRRPYNWSLGSATKFRKIQKRTPEWLPNGPQHLRRRPVTSFEIHTKTITKSRFWLRSKRREGENGADETSREQIGHRSIRKRPAVLPQFWFLGYLFSVFYFSGSTLSAIGQKGFAHKMGPVLTIFDNNAA